jgi:ADP-ribosylglycohydrolase
MIELQARVQGCLFGGAVGDALGAPVEFLSLLEIRRQFGHDGIRDYVPAYGRCGAITDDTQMTLFTAEGLMRAWVRMQLRGICNTKGVMHHAYLRWLLTQNEKPRKFGLEIGTDGWLFGLQPLHNRRAPGTTCLAALRTAEGFGSPDVARNNSKGCGGVMRVAPVGLFASAFGTDDFVFDLASDAAALTHGHPSGFLSAGYLAVTVAALLRGDTPAAALDAAEVQLRRHDGYQEVANAVTQARALAERGRPEPEKLETLGGGWVAEEALAVAICCMLTASNFADGITLAANHSGDSDSTAAIAGNLLGAQFGEAAIPRRWLAELELQDEICQLADDLTAIVTGTIDAESAWDRYPGW